MSLGALPRSAARPGRERLSRRHDRLEGGRRNDPHDVAEAAGKERARRHRRDRTPHRRSDRGRGDRSAAADRRGLERLFDLSTLDFQRLAALFAGGARKTAAEILRGQTEERARALASRNPTRIDLLERLNDLIERYNSGSMDVERLFEELTAFTRTLDEEKSVISRRAWTRTNSPSSTSSPAPTRG
jgi:hypothetical protein